MIPLMMIFTAVLINGTYLDQEATINNTYNMLLERTEYEYGYNWKSMDEYEETRKGDCTEAAIFVQRKVSWYSISTFHRFGWANCSNSYTWDNEVHDWVRTWNLTLHDWIEYKGKPYDSGGCKDYTVII